MNDVEYLREIARRVVTQAVAIDASRVNEIADALEALHGALVEARRRICDVWCEPYDDREAAQSANPEINHCEECRNATAALALVEKEPKPKPERVWPDPDHEYCCASQDGECDWPHCPQIRDGEPAASGRSCPLKWHDR